MQIIDSPKFKEEYRQILQYLETAKDSDKKKEVKRLLQELISCVKKIDQAHADLLISRRLSDDLNGPKEKILEIRKRIFKTIAD